MISLHYSYYILGVIILALGLAWYKSTFPTKNDPPKTDKERQATHQRGLQSTVLWLLSLAVITGYVSLFYAQVVMKIAEKDLVQFWQAQMMLLTAWIGVVGYAFGTSLSGLRNAESLRSIAEKKGEE